MVALSHHRWSAQAYLDFERKSTARHALIDGELYLMAGASENHNLITANIIITLGMQLRGRPCKLYPSDMRVKIHDLGNYHYPDVSVVCGEAQIEDHHQDTLLNPTLLVEVLSPSTEAYDRGRKFAEYRTISSLQTVVFVAQDHAHIEVFVRQDLATWEFSEVKASVGRNAVDLASIGCQLSLAEVYDKLSFATQAPPENEADNPPRI
jgi:Uma2 family endonuclease